MNELESAYFTSPLGQIRIVAENGLIIGLDFIDGQVAEAGASILPGEPKKWLAAYFEGKNPSLAGLPLAPQGSAFCRMVWGIIAQIPYGATMTYGDIARRIGSSPRAVGQATGRNPIALLIPCHRVMGAGNKLTGYGPGIWRKQWLLAHEAGRQSKPTWRQQQKKKKKES